MSPAKLIDHRDLAKELDLYMLSDKGGQGLPFLLPNWVIIRNQIQQFIRQKWFQYDFQEVMTPILGDKYLYETSEHLAHYQDYMFPPLIRNNEISYLRPMTCPHHCLIYQQKPRSYQELPFRLAENSLLFRYESSGSLKGLERARYLELADHHIFVTPDHLKEELKNNFYFIQEILNGLEFTIGRLICSLHDPHNPDKYHSNKELWRQSENLLKEALNEMNLDYSTQKGEAAFYGPKLDLEVKAADNKFITIATIQLDFLLPQKFNLHYLDKEQKLKTPVLIHHSPIGSYQRFIALLLEQKKGKLPTWLSPWQVAILPLNETPEVKNYCEKLVQQLINWRVKVLTKKTLNYRIRQVHQQKIPYYLVVGSEEIITKKLKLIYAYQDKVIEVSEKELKKVII